MKVNQKEIIEKILQTNGRYFGVTFIKKNGEIRKLNGRLGVKKYLTGVGRNHPAHLINAFDQQQEGYRYVTKDRILSARIDGEEYEAYGVEN